MKPQLLRLLFTFIYIFNDILYVTLSKKEYNVATKKIQGKPITSRTHGAMMAWICMALGWYFLIAPIIETSTYTKTLFVSFIYGLAIFGTFNFTLYAMFEKWTGYIMIRDLIWGLSSSIFISVLYRYIIEINQ